MKPWLASYSPDTPAEINPDAYASVVDLLDQACETFADKPAFTCFGKTISYAETRARSQAVSAWLQNRLGVKTGDRIAVMTPNTFAFPVAMMGILGAGAAQVNVNPLYTPRELRHQLNDAGVETIFIYSGSTPVLAEIIADTPVRNVVTIDLGDVIDLPIPSPAVDERLSGFTRFADVLTEGADLPFTAPAITGDNTLFLQYTGGTTGLSKGAVLSHRNMVANTEQYKAFMPGAVDRGTEVVVGALPLYHIFGLMLMLSYMSVGGRMVLIPNPRDMDAFIAAIKNEKISVMAGVNTLFAGLAAHPAAAEIDFSNHKISIGGGAAVLEATSEQWKKLSGAHIKEGYGLSETSPVLCINPLGSDEFTNSCGLPVASTDIKLLKDDGTEAGPGETGEICAKGPQVMSGYWEKPEANAEAFTADGYFRTGDIGQFTPEGRLMIVDRKKDMIIVSGFNVFPNEVEAAATQCEGVLECACVGVPHEKTGEAVRLFVVCRPGATLDEATFVEHCRKELAGYKVPHQIRFVDELPKSNVGKILRRELRNVA